MTKRLALPLLTALTAGSLTVMTAVVPPAAHATSWYVERSTFEERADNNDGWSTAKATLRWTGKRSFTVTSTVTDRCKSIARKGVGDGEGAYLYAYLRFKDGSRTRRLVNADTNGCSNDGVGGVSKVRSVATTKRIASAQIRLLERDSGGGDADGVRKGETTGSLADDSNPFTH